MANFLENFTGSAVEITSHTADSGESWSYLSDASNRPIYLDGSGAIYPDASASNLGLVISSWTPSSADYEVTATIKVVTAAGDLGIMGRLTGTTWAGGSYYLGRYEVGTGYEIFKNINGSYTQLGSTVAGTAPVTNDTLTLAFSGSSITLKKNGSAVVGPVTDTALAAAGKIGLWLAGPQTLTTGLHVEKLEGIGAVGALAAGTVSAVVASTTSASVTTTAPTGGTSPYSYQLQRAPDSSGSAGTYANVGSAVTGQTGSYTWTDTGLTTGATYWYRVVYTDNVAASATSAGTSVLIQGSGTYYVASSGSDANNGTSTGTPWQTITKVNTHGQVPGDTILFNGGDTFSGNLHVATSGTVGRRITFGSYGTGKASISPGTSYGVWIDDASHVTVQDLIVAGPGVSTAGVTTSLDAAIKITLAGTADLAGVKLLRNTISGSFYGIVLQVASGNTHSIVRPVIAGNVITTCGFAGIASWQLPNGQAHTTRITAPVIQFNTVANIYGTNNAAEVAQGDWSSNTQSGFGMYMGNCLGGLIEANLIHHTGAASSPTAGGGPVTIMTYECDGVIVRGNEAHHSFGTEGRDGQGVDFDGGSRNCIAEYNYFHDNDGPAFMDFPIGGFTANTGNVFRWNICENNGRRAAGAGVDNHQTGARVYSSANCTVENNTFYDVKTSTSEGATIGVSGTGHIVRGNLFVISGSGPNFGAVDGGTIVQGNHYHATGGATFSLTYASTNYTSLAALQAVAETVGGVGVGSTGDPLVDSPGNGGSDYPVGSIALALTAYDPTLGSPLLTSGLDPVAAYGTDPVREDFHRNPVRTISGAYPVGAVATPATGGLSAGGGISRSRLVNAGGM